MCEFSLSKTPVQARVVFISFPLLLTLSIFHYSPMFSAASWAPMQKLLVPWTQYFRNPISIGLQDTMLKISVVAGMRFPNSDQPRGAKPVSAAGRIPCRIVPEQGGNLGTLCLATLALCELTWGRAALKFNEDNDWASMVISGHRQQGRSRSHAWMSNHFAKVIEKAPGLGCGVGLQASMVLYSIPMEDQSCGNLNLFCAYFSPSSFSDFPSPLVWNF